MNETNLLLKYLKSTIGSRSRYMSSALISIKQDFNFQAFGMWHKSSCYMAFIYSYVYTHITVRKQRDNHYKHMVIYSP